MVGISKCPICREVPTFTANLFLPTTNTIEEKITEILSDGAEGSLALKRKIEHRKVCDKISTISTSLFNEGDELSKHKSTYSRVLSTIQHKKQSIMEMQSSKLALDKEASRWAVEMEQLKEQLKIAQHQRSEARKEQTTVNYLDALRRELDTSIPSDPQWRTLDEDNPENKIILFHLIDFTKRVLDSKKRQWQSEEIELRDLLKPLSSELEGLNTDILKLKARMDSLERDREEIERRRSQYEHYLESRIPLLNSLRSPSS